MKGVAYAKHADAGRPDTTARAHNAQGADELLLFDIDASREGRAPNLAAVGAVAKACLMPLAVGGGICSIDIAYRCIDAGADKLCVTSTALDDPGLIGRLAHVFGSQAVMVGVDVMTTRGNRQLYDHRCGRPVTNFGWEEWLKRAVAEGAGEVRLMAVEREGSRSGLDIDLLAQASALVDVPIILEGGAGSLDHVATAIRAGAEAVALGTMLVFSDNNIHKVKSFLKNAGLEMRL